MSEPRAVLVPRINPNDDRALLTSWLIASGSPVEADQPIATMETTKAAFDVHAPCSGYLFFKLDTSEMVDVGSAIAWISTDAQPPDLRISASAPTDDLPGVIAARFSRKALRLMQEHGLVLEDFASAASSVERIGVEDVERALAMRRAPPQHVAAQAVPAPSPVVAPGTSSSLLAQSASKIMEATILANVYRNVVPSTVKVAIADDLIGVRLKRIAAADGPLSLLEFVLHACATLLRDVPELHGYHAQNKAWTYDEPRIGFAINAAGRGLKVPSLAVGPKSSLRGVASRMRDLTLRYFRDELTPSDLIGGTFTITDLSGQGVTDFLPVLNERQSAILGICAPHPSTHFRNFILTFDHRMADGMQAAAFLMKLSDVIAEE